MNKLSLGQVEWKEFAMVDIFDIVDGYYNKKPPIKKEGKIPFLGATQYCNGVTGFYSQDIINNYDKVGELSKTNKNERIYKAKCIAITNNGSVGNAYYQSSSFTCSHDVTPIYLKARPLNKSVALFLIPLLNKTGQSFGYAKKWRPKRMRKSKILLPIDSLGNPNWKFMEDYMRQQEEKLLKSLKNKLKKKIVLNSEKIKPLSECNWKEFYFTEIFDEIQRGKRLTKQNQVEGNIPYVSSTSVDNGVDNFIGNKDRVRIFDNCITLANSGSVGSTFFHHYNFIASDHVTKLERNGLDNYAYQFMIPVINRLSEKYSFNREINDIRIKREKILLPIDGYDNPDFEYMSNYMKKVESEKIKTYFQKKKLSY